MHITCIKYPENIQIHHICIKYAQNMPSNRLQHSKYADYMQKISKKYSQYANKICKKHAKNMQNMHKSMYWHILHIHAPPTLLMPA